MTSHLEHRLKSPFKRVHLLLLALLGIIVHSFFLWLVNQEITTVDDKRGKINFNVEILPVTQELTPEEKELARWLTEIQPPNLLSPDAKNGYSAFSYKKLKQQIPSLVVNPFPMLVFTPAETSQTLLAAKQFSAADLLKESWLKTNIVVHDDYTIAPQPDGVFWTDDEGRALDPQPQFDKHQLLRITNSDIILPRNQLTVIDIIYHPDSPIIRTVLRKSCGTRECDKMAIKTLRRYLLDNHLEKKLTGVHIFWKLNNKTEKD